MSIMLSSYSLLYCNCFGDFVIFTPIYKIKACNCGCDTKLKFFQTEIG